MSAANTGYAFVGSEILSYTSVGVSSLSGVVRGVDGTKQHCCNYLKDDIITPSMNMNWSISEKINNAEMM